MPESSTPVEASPSETTHSPRPPSTQQPAQQQQHQQQPHQQQQHQQQQQEERDSSQSQQPPPSASRAPLKQTTLSPLLPTSTTKSPPPSLSAPPRQDSRVSFRVSEKPPAQRAQSGQDAAMDLPDRLRDDADAGGAKEGAEEEEEEVLQPQRLGGGTFMNMNQSIFGLIAAAGSKVDFTDRFEGQSSDEEEEEDDGAARHRTQRQPASQTVLLQKPASPGQPAFPVPQQRQQQQQQQQQQQERRHRRKISESRLLRSVPVLSKLSTKSRSSRSSKGKKQPPAQPDESPAEGSTTTTATATTSSTTPSSPAPAIEVTRATEGGRLAPVMSRMLEARAEMAARPSFELERTSSERRREAAAAGEEAGPTELAKKLKEIFEFDEPEEVIEEYPCWLLQHVLLQGYMYITARHIAFYAYLPKKAQEVAKSGYLAKCGKRNPKYNRYWFRLKGDVLSYYRDSQNLYFPSGQIDLRYGISAAVTDRDRDRDRDGGGLHFSLVTHHRTYHFRADSAPSAKEWVKALQRVIFRSHNDGDSVKISLPIQNVIDVEETQMLDFADTCKIRVIDNDETYAIDEYFFSFFSFGKEALHVLRILVEDSSRTPAADVDDDRSRPSRDRQDPAAKPRAGRLSDSVRATLQPVSPLSPRSPSRGPSPRASGDFTRSSFDALRPFGGCRSSTDAASQELPPRRSFSDRRRSRSRHDEARMTPTTTTTTRDDGQGGRRNHQHQEQPPSDDTTTTTQQGSGGGGSSESYVQSLGDATTSQASLSAALASHQSSSSGGEDPPSASQLLRRSDVFYSPTVGRRTASPSRLAGSPGLSPEAREPPPRAAPPRSSLAAFSGSRHAHSTGHLLDSGAAGEDARPATPTLQQITKMGSYPLQRAGAFADYLNRQSRRMSNLLATESMGYVEKVSGMWKGGKKHYHGGGMGGFGGVGGVGHGVGGARALDDEDEMRMMMMMGAEDAEDRAAPGKRFREHFALPEDETLQAAYFGYMMRVLPLYGKIYLSDRHFCFRSLLPGTRTKLILPLRDVENVEKEKGFRFGYAGLVVVIRGHEELFFEFGKAELRDDCAVTLVQNIEAARYLRGSQLLDRAEAASAEAAAAERDALQEARRQEDAGGGDAAAAAAWRAREVPLPQDASTLSGGGGGEDAPTILFDDPKASFLDFKPPQPLRITCLTIGSRGDVQPYIALGKGLQAEGHRVRIATHAEFRGWIEGHGLEFGLVEGDPNELMRLCIQNGTFTWAFLKEANAKFRGWLDELLGSAWAACRGSDLLIESPSAMAGIHIAEALRIPYFRAFTMPWTRTRAYPHAFVMPGQRMGGAYNYVTYVMFDNVFWKATAHQINRWRNAVLGLPNTTLERLQPNKVPFLYNFSPCVVPPPLDYSDWIRVTGYWFLDEGSSSGGWTPPADLVAFLARARRDGKKVVYVGFGSIIVPDPARMTQEVVDAVRKADVRCVLSKGWSDRLGPKKDDDDDDDNDDRDRAEVPLPPEIFPIQSAPHDWLFAQMDAVAHHGGSGTTGASLRAGVPTIVRPFFGDQFFFGTRVEDLGVGICLKKWGAHSFARALWEATHSERMIVKARLLGEQIRRENGVDTAIQCIYRDLEYAKSLILAKVAKNAAARKDGGAAGATSSGSATPGGRKEGGGEDDDDEEREVEDDDEEEESWTFVTGGDVDDEEIREAAAAAAAGGGGSVGFRKHLEGTRALGSRVLGGVRAT